MCLHTLLQFVSGHYLLLEVVVPLLTAPKLNLHCDEVLAHLQNPHWRFVLSLFFLGGVHWLVSILKLQLQGKLGNVIQKSYLDQWRKYTIYFTMGAHSPVSNLQYCSLFAASGKRVRYLSISQKLVWRSLKSRAEEIFSVFKTHLTVFLLIAVLLALLPAFHPLWITSDTSLLHLLPNFACRSLYLFIPELSPWICITVSFATKYMYIWIYDDVSSVKSTPVDLMDLLCNSYNLSVF